MRDDFATKFEEDLAKLMVRAASFQSTTTTQVVYSSFETGVSSQVM